MLPQHLDHWLAPFPAKVTAVTNSSGTYLYEWIEQITDGSGGYTNAVPARSGTNTVDPALELNNRNLTPSNTVVWMRFRGMSGANTVYEFDGSGMVVSSSGSTNLTVQDDTGSPSYTGINTINVVTGATTGLNISNPATGIAGFTIDPASDSTAGVINTGSQTIAGVKTFANNTVHTANVSIWNVSTVENRLDLWADGGNTAVGSISGYSATSAFGSGSSDKVIVFSSKTTPILILDYSSNIPRIGFFSGGVDYAQLYLLDSGFGNLQAGSNGGVGGMYFQSGLYISGQPVSGAVPANSSDTGTTGHIAQDGSYLYICTSTNTWKRITLTAF